MSAIGRDRDDRHVEQTASRNDTTAPRSGIVHTVDGGDVTVRLDVWGQLHYFGPIPWCAAQGAGPAAGDSCVLLSDSYGQPLIAIVIGSGDPV